MARSKAPQREQPSGVTHIGTRDIPVADLQRLPGNPRRGVVEEIRKSVRRHGQYRSICVRDTGDGLVILAGNHTADALQAEGRETARCDVIQCTDDEARRIALADNRMAELGGYENEALAELLAYLDGDFEGTGWAAENLDALFRGIEASGDSPTDPSDEWENMPDFDNPGQPAAFSAAVHFPTTEDADRFFALIERPRSKVLWWPHGDGHRDYEPDKMEVAE